MSLLFRWTSVALISVCAAAPMAAQIAHGYANGTAAVRGADSLVSGSEQAVLEWARSAPAAAHRQDAPRD